MFVKIHKKSAAHPDKRLPSYQIADASSTEKTYRNAAFAPGKRRDADDICLFDAEEGVLRKIELPGERAGGGPRWVWWLSGVAAGAGMAWWLSGRGW